MSVTLTGVISSNVEVKPDRTQFEISQDNWPLPIICVSTPNYERVNSKPSSTLEVRDKVTLIGRWDGSVFHFDYLQKETSRQLKQVLSACWNKLQMTLFMPASWGAGEVHGIL